MRFSSRFFGMALACAALLSACGGGGGGSSSSTTRVGVFSDSAVEGITYVTGGTTGLTDASGRFTYTEGQTVTFRVGDIVLGSVTGKPFVSPVSLVSGATDETHATVTNIAKFLQTIDDDNNPANGIRLTAAIRTAAIGKAINFAQTTAAYDGDGDVATAYTALTTASTAGTHAGVSDANAQNHLRDTLIKAMAGTYSGTYSGNGSSGTFSVVIANNGAITGSGIESISSFSFAVNGTLSSNGVTNFASGVAGNATFTGSVNINTGTLSGNWTATGYGPGTFSGKK